MQHQQGPPPPTFNSTIPGTASVSETGPSSNSQGSFSQQHITTASSSTSNAPSGSGVGPGTGLGGGGGGGSGGGYYIPPASDLTASNHDRALGVIDSAFEQTDRMLDQRDMKAFGDSSENIFQELIKIRKKQLALAAKHINIETIADDDKSLAPDGKLLDAADKDEVDPLQFARKGQELEDLMASLEDLGRSMSGFHELSNSLNKQPFTYLSGSSKK